MAIVWRGSTSIEASAGGTWSIGLPFGTQVGDTIVLVGVFTNHSGASAFNVTDSRMVKVVDLDLPNGHGTGSLWYGTATDLSAVTGTGTAGTTTNGGVVVAATLVNKVQPSRLTTTTALTESFPVPGLSGVTEGAILVSVARHGIGGMSFTEPDGYTSLDGRVSYAAAVLAYTEQTPAPAGTAVWDYTSSGDIPSATAIVGVGPLALVAPPCRLFPRADGLGVGGGRHYPPSKSQQRSGRRFGYY